MKAMGECFNLTMGQSSAPAVPTMNKVKACRSFRATPTLDFAIPRGESTALHLLGSLVQMIRLSALGHRLEK